MRPFFGPQNQTFATNYNRTFGTIQENIFSIINASYSTGQCPPENTSGCQGCGEECEDCAAKLNAGEYALDIEYPDMTFPTPGDIIYGGFYLLREPLGGCAIAIDVWASCTNDSSGYQCGCGKTYYWTVGCDEEGGPVITGSSDGEWGSCGCNSEGGSFAEGPGNPLLCNPTVVTAPKPTVSIRKI
jgi:hypothetical protein